MKKGERNPKHWTKRRKPFDVRAWRMRMGLTQVEAAKMVHVARRTIIRWESVNESMKPYPKHVYRMKELESVKLAGMLPGAAPNTPPRVNRRMKAPSFGTGQPAHITIAPSSF